MPNKVSDHFVIIENSTLCHPYKETNPWQDSRYNILYSVLWGSLKSQELGTHQQPSRLCFSFTYFQSVIYDRHTSPSLFYPALSCKASKTESGRFLPFEQLYLIRNKISSKHAGLNTISFQSSFMILQRYRGKPII